MRSYTSTVTSRSPFAWSCTIARPSRGPSTRYQTEGVSDGPQPPASSSSAVASTVVPFTPWPSCNCWAFWRVSLDGGAASALAGTRASSSSRATRMGYVFLRVTSPNVSVEDSKHLFPGNRPKTNHPPVVALLTQGHREPCPLDLTEYHIRAAMSLRA